MRAKLYQSSRAMATLTPSSNQKDLAAREWKRSTAARAVMKARKLSSSADGVALEESGIGKEEAVVFSFVYLCVLCGLRFFRLKQLLRPSQIAQRPEISRCECKTILVLIPHRTQCEAPEFHTYSTAIPVIGCLHRGVLQEP